MDIHKPEPKPWHGVREFLKEYVIIVVGVLTALAAEQGVEWLRWQEKVADANGQMRLELSRAYADAQERIALTPCLNQRITQLEDQLVKTKGTWTPLPPMVQRHGRARALIYAGRAWDMQFFRSAMNDGTVAHIDRDLQPKLARIYWQIGLISQYNQQELPEVNSLNILNMPFPLDDGTRAGLLQALERERGYVASIAFLSEALGKGVTGAVKIDKAMAQDVLNTSNTIPACRDLGLL